MKNYFPFQPEIQKNTYSYKELKPAGFWYSQDIALFYQFKTVNSSPTTLSLIPDGCFDILFCCHPTLSSAFLWTSPFHRKKQPEFHRDCEYFGVRFFPEQSIIKLNYPMSELLDRKIPLFEVMNGDKSIIELIASGKSFSERIEQFEKFLIKARFNMGKDQNMVGYAIQKIYSSGGMLNISELSDSIGYSQQYIRKKFEEYIGFSPKQFCQVVKFQNSLDMFLERDRSDILDIIYDNGYYDQAHFIKEFKKFTHLTPKQYKKYFSVSHIN
ncbi:helix-turn-helix domain-containing protein [Bacillus methanolicus PB1]|uniref:Helix-turn-helix domain-containing protein n=1 Tax=Bacillus methanolicus PB1 TaxID=997296 RepID=I3E6C3_BACMT|nr:helix-turn-helix domain-containing protein [Bacillus methanolicus]EIJ82044.1 helix-turn-helix domain-containing protein [Bacillus methanolicus PB1]